MAESSTPPKERINITYKPKTNGQTPEVELPLKLMVMANFTGGSTIPLEEREAIAINKNTFNQVMQKMGVEAHFSVKNTLHKEADELNVNLSITNMKDFSPDNIAKQVPEINKLLKLREALIALKGPMGNIPDFRKAVLEALKDENTKQKLLLEIQNNNNQEQ